MEVKDIIETLTAVNQHLTSAQRELLQLTLRLQHVAEDQLSLAAVEKTAENLQATAEVVQEVARVPGVQRIHVGADYQARRFTGDEVKPAAAAPSMSDALETAKTVLKQALCAAGQSQLVDMVDHVSEADLKRIQAVTEQPTPADGPTPVTVTESHDAKRDRESLALFSGADSIFVAHLNADTVHGGRGQLGKGITGLERWQEDARWIDEARLKGWPSGFYQNRDTKATQLLINTGRAAILVDGLPNAGAQVFVLRYDTKTGFEPAEVLPLLERTRVLSYITTAFNKMLKEVAG
jgi:hypothetical protein